MHPGATLVWHAEPDAATVFDLVITNGLGEPVWTHRVPTSGGLVPDAITRQPADRVRGAIYTATMPSLPANTTLREAFGPGPYTMRVSACALEGRARCTRQGFSAGVPARFWNLELVEPGWPGHIPWIPVDLTP